MDIQKMFDMISAAHRMTRGEYQLTLGQLIDQLKALPEDMPISYRDGSAPNRAMSYRGYYADLAFNSQPNASTVGTLLKTAAGALNKAFEGYKGGNYEMGTDAPLWASEYGCTSRTALMSITVKDGTALIETKQID